jgi:glycosyltransferase involved in cell wall biosynthesis
MKSRRCFAITGLDGSGKTTLANWLVEYLRSKGYRCRYVWIRSLHTFAYLTSRILTPLGWHRTFRNPNGIVISRFEVHEGTFARKIWPVIEFVSVLPWIILKTRLLLFLGYIIVLDRCTIDTTISIALTARDMNFADSSLGRILLKLMPKNCAVIFLDADFFTVLKRKPDIHNTSDEIKNWITLYRVLARNMNAFCLNTTILTIEQTRKKVIDLLFAESAPKSQVTRGTPLDFSIVIPTCNRPRMLKSLLKSIIEQEILSTSVIIVDQSDNQLTFNVAIEMQKEFLDREILLEYLYVNQKSGSRARNVGIAHSKGEIVFLMDDDVVFSRDYIKNILKVYKDYPDAVGVQGLIVNPKTLLNMKSLGSRLENHFKRAFFLSHFRENTWEIMPSINDVFPFPLTTTISTQRLQGPCSYKRKILDSFRYDENLEEWSFLEDFDISYRIYKSKVGSLYITPEARLIHKKYSHLSFSIKKECYKKIVNRTYMFFKLIKQTPCNCAIFCWSILGFLLTTTLGTILGRKKEKNRWIPIYLIEAAFYSLRHLKEIRQLNLSFLSNVH